VLAIQSGAGAKKARPRRNQRVTVAGRQARKLRRGVTLCGVRTRLAVGVFHWPNCGGYQSKKAISDCACRRALREEIGFSGGNRPRRCHSHHAQQRGGLKGIRPVGKRLETEHGPGRTAEESFSRNALDLSRGRRAGNELGVIACPVPIGISLGPRHRGVHQLRGRENAPGPGGVWRQRICPAAHLRHERRTKSMDGGIIIPSRNNKPPRRLPAGERRKARNCRRRWWSGTGRWLLHRS